MAINLLDVKPHKVSRDLSGYVTYIYGEGGTGKAQPVSTLIPTPKGHIPLGDLKVGDYVYNRKGEPVKILQVFPQGEIDNYKVTFEDGRIAYCNNEHIWTVYTSRNNFKDITVTEMLENGIWKDATNASKRTARYSIPINEAVQKEEKEYFIHPYIIGAFLGDGCCLERILTFSSSDEEIVNHIADLIGNVTPKKSSEKNYSWIFVINEEDRVKNNGNVTIKNVQTKTFFKDYEKYLIQESKDKRIPPEYLEGNIEQRYELLRGLMDTDGSIESSKGTVRFTTISKGLVKDILQLGRSLGYRLNVIEDNRKEKYNNEEGICYSISFNIDNEEKDKLFYLSRKKEIALSFKNVKKNRKYNWLKIHNIEKMPEKEEMVCIYVDDPEHLYLTEDYIVTHNTTLASQLDKALLLGFEIGYLAIPGIMAQPIKTWGEMTQVIRELKKPEVQQVYHSIVVDTVDIAASLCEKYICNREGVDSLSDIGWGKGFKMVKEEWEEAFRTITHLGYSLFFISHAKDKVFKREDGTEYNQIVPSLTNMYNEIVRNMSDIQGYAHSVKTDSGSKVMLTLRSADGSVECKSRFKYIQPEIEFNYESLSKALNEAIDKEAKLTDNKYVMDEKNVDSKMQTYDYDALMTELQDLISQLMTANQSNAGKITSIIDKYLGKGKKVMDTTPDQAELIYLILDEMKDTLL